MPSPAAPRPTATPLDARRLRTLYAGFAALLLTFVLLMGLLERAGLSRTVMGLTFLLGTLAVYAIIGILSRTTDAEEYYVAGRRIPPFYNGMATSADWMSAASFIGLAGTLYVQGYSGLAFVLGWTGGYCLVALLLVPYLRRFEHFTLPDFLGQRYGGHAARLVGVLAAILCSFTYLVAQIYGVGLITSWLTGVAFEVGVFLGLGGILMCSLLGGMRAVTWTQVAQCIVLMLAYTLPVVWLSVQQTGNPVPQWAYGAQLAKITQKEAELQQSPGENEVRAIFSARIGELQRKLEQPVAALYRERHLAETHLEELRAGGASPEALLYAEKNLARLPKDEAAALRMWTADLQEAQLKVQPLNGMRPHIQPFAGDPDGTPQQRATFEASRANFLALVFCLTIGTAALPHILMRYHTVPSVQAARQSVAWSLLFIGLLYLMAPALAVLLKFEIFHHLVGTPFDALPAWIDHWSRMDASLLRVEDINQDGILQLNELSLNSDILVLAAPEIGGLPYVVTCLTAAGGLAAALSTADGLLLTIASGLSHDIYYKMVDPRASTMRRVSISKVVVLMVALAAGYIAVQKPADILFLVSAAFSFAASAFFPVLVLGIFWKRATTAGALAGIAAGLGVTTYYMATTQPWLRSVLGLSGPVPLWWDIEPISAGVFGVPVGFAVIVLVSLYTPAPPAAVQQWVDRLRHPETGPGQL